MASCVRVQLVDLSCQLLLHAAVPFALDENVVAALTSSSSSVISGASNSPLKEKLLQVERFGQDTANFQVTSFILCEKVGKTANSKDREDETQDKIFGGRIALKCVARN